MKTKTHRSTFKKHPAKTLVSLLIVALLVCGSPACYAQPEAKQDPTPAPAPASAPAQEAPDAPPITPEQLDSLVAPIALYPDPLLSQVLVAATYPLEVVQLQQWLDTKGKVMNDKAKTDAVQKMELDPSIQSMVVLPDVLKRMSENIKWTSDLGNAFLAQQTDVMDAVQRLRSKATDKGNLKSTEQMKVETKVVESKTVVVIEQANPEVVYVPAYDPAVVWGVSAYPYPPMYYPPAGYYAGAAIGFGVGIAIGAAWGGGGWGYGCGWGHNDVNINMNNNFQRNTNIQGGNNIRGGNTVNNRPAGAGGNNKWQHNPQHRGGAPYSNKGVANKYGGSARGDSMDSRRASASQNPSRGDSGRAQAGTSDRNTGGGRQQAGSSDRGGGGRQQAGTSDRNTGGGRQQAGSSDRGGGGRDSSGFGGGGGGGGGGDRIGSRDVSRSPSSSNRSNSSFGGGGGYGGGSARSSSSRGSSSMGGGGGMSRGGGGGGMSRGGGGGGRR